MWAKLPEIKLDDDDDVEYTENYKRRSFFELHKISNACKIVSLYPQNQITVERCSSGRVLFDFVFSPCSIFPFIVCSLYQVLCAAPILALRLRFGILSISER